MKSNNNNEVENLPPMTIVTQNKRKSSTGDWRYVVPLRLALFLSFLVIMAGLFALWGDLSYQKASESAYLRAWNDFQNKSKILEQRIEERINKLSNLPRQEKLIAEKEEEKQTKMQNKEGPEIHKDLDIQEPMIMKIISYKPIPEILINSAPRFLGRSFLPPPPPPPPIAIHTLPPMEYQNLEFDIETLPPPLMVEPSNRAPKALSDPKFLSRKMKVPLPLMPRMISPHNEDFGQSNNAKFQATNNFDIKNSEIMSTIYEHLTNPIIPLTTDDFPNYPPNFETNHFTKSSPTIIGSFSALKSFPIKNDYFNQLQKTYLDKDLIGYPNIQKTGSSSSLDLDVLTAPEVNPIIENDYRHSNSYDDNIINFDTPSNFLENNGGYYRDYSNQDYSNGDRQFESSSFEKIASGLAPQERYSQEPSSVETESYNHVFTNPFTFQSEPNYYDNYQYDDVSSTMNQESSIPPSSHIKPYDSKLITIIKGQIDPSYLENPPVKETVYSTSSNGNNVHRLNPRIDDGLITIQKLLNTPNPNN